MRLRVKLGSQSQVIDFEGQSPASVRLRDLRQSVLRQFHLVNETNFQLSLNKRDVLAGEDETLDTFGIVTSDIIHIIGPNVPQANQGRNASQMRNRPQPLATYSGSDIGNLYDQGSTVSSTSNNRHMTSTQESVPHHSKSESSVPVNGQDVSSSMDISDDTHLFSNRFSAENSINRYLREPLVIRESTETQVPVLLAQIFKSVECNTNSDALWVVLHTLMLESGFLPSETLDPTVMPSNWKLPGYYSCTYDYSAPPEFVGTCSLVGITVGASVIVHALVKSNPNFKTEHLQLRCTDFVRALSQDVASSYRALDRLSRLFKDTVSLVVINELVTAAGFPGRQGLQALPYEVKLRVLSFLDPGSLCRLGQTCQEFSSVYKDKTLWRLQYIQAFGKPEDCSLARNWYELFRVQYLRYKEEQERRRTILYLDETDPPWGYPRPGPYHLFQPGMPGLHIVGGDYDLNPEYRAGVQNPLGLGNSGGPLLPQIVIPGPFSPGLGNLGQPGQPRSGPGNLTGSPFSSNFRGPFQ